MKDIKIRQSNLELLRIVSMVMIVGLHYFNKDLGGALSHLKTSDYNYYIAYGFESLFIVSVGCYVLITGYFQIEKPFVKINKVLQILVLVVFYAVFFYIVATIIGEVAFSVNYLGAVFLLSFIKNWFVRVYIILYVLSPFLNAGLNKLDKKAYKKLIVIMLIFFSVWPSFLPFSPVTDIGYGIITFILFYSVGGYAKKHYIINHPKKYYLIGYFACASITFLMNRFLSGRLDSIWGYNFIFNILGAIFLFLFFTTLNIKSKKINYFASFTFGVFLVHTSTPYMYEKLLHCSWFWHSPLFIVHAIGSIIIVYAISTLIDICRKWIFDSLSKYIVPIVKKVFPLLWEQIP